MVAGLVNIAGWFVTFRQARRLERERRAERVIDIQNAGSLARDALLALERSLGLPLPSIVRLRTRRTGDRLRRRRGLRHAHLRSPLTLRRISPIELRDKPNLSSPTPNVRHLAAASGRVAIAGGPG
jgi:hypothetical protein